jgi:hypothetical protein
MPFTIMEVIYLPNRAVLSVRHVEYLVDLRKVGTSSGFFILVTEVNRVNDSSRYS